jgi:DNA-directed RNA polymerase subunit M/transcription elongation factor TFIIS
MHLAIVPKTCPECRCKKYHFRARRTVPAAGDRPASVETKYRCAECGHEWKVLTPAASGAGPARAG